MSDNKQDKIEKRCNRVKTGPRHNTFNHPNRLFRKTLSQDELKTFLGSDASNVTYQNKSNYHPPLSSNHNKHTTITTMKTNKPSVNKKIVSSNSNLNVQHNTSQVSSVTHQSVKLNNQFPGNNVKTPSSKTINVQIPGNINGSSSNNSQKNGLYMQSNSSRNSNSVKNNRFVVTDDKSRSLDAAENQVSNRISESSHSNQKCSSIHKTPMLKATASTQSQELANHSSFEDDDNDYHLSAKRNCSNRLSYTMSSKKSKTSDVSSSIASNSNRLSVIQFPVVDGPANDEAMSIESLSCKVAELERAVQYLSSKMDNYQHELSRGISNLGSTQNARKELTPFLHGCVVAVVKEFFKAVKFLDNSAILQIGDMIVGRFLQVSNQDPENIHDKGQYNAVIHKAKKILSVHKCHVKASIRSATAGKFHCLLLH